MNIILKIIHWKRCKSGTIILLCLLIVLNFYGLYTNKFYIFKPDNYIFPILTTVHFIFLYVLQFKIREGEYTDPQMRNLEYALYVIFLVYVFKVLDTFYILLSYQDYANHVIPPSFLPMGFLIIGLQVLLLLFTLITFWHRKVLVGDYNFDNINENLDSWN